MDKVLYVSDLDGTLLRSDGKLSSYTKGVLSEFIRRGGLFSVATARTIEMTREVIRDLDLQLPVLLNNGAVIYDPVQENVVEMQTVAQQTVERLYRVFRSYRITGFMYAIQKNRVHLYYQKLRGPEDYYYFGSRFMVYGGNVSCCESLVEAAVRHQPVFFVVYGPPERLSPVYQELLSVPGVKCTLYDDYYSGGQYYYIDIHSDQASKSIGILRLKQLSGAARVAAFGDNFNDLEMLETADEAYVPHNGVEAAKRIAREVLDTNNQDGVARFLERRIRLDTPGIWY